VIVVDQMRADYLLRFSTAGAGGFSRLRREGASFTRARHAHVPTETAVGHAALATGCFPSRHGIVANEWWDRSLGRKVLAAAGDDGSPGPQRLLCPTLGEALKAASPESRVFSLSGKGRAAVLMGGRRPDLDLWYDPSEGRFLNGGYYPKPPAWAARFNEEIALAPDRKDELRFTPRFDSLALALARRAVSEEGLGKGPAADLLWLSLTGTDLIGHRWGPDSPEMRVQLVNLDREIGSFLDFLDARFGRGGVLVALAGDHGVSPLPESEAGKRIGGRRVSWTGFERDLEKGLRERLGEPKDARDRWVLAFCFPHLYLNFEMGRGNGIAPEALRVEARKVLAGNPEVAHAFSPAELRGPSQAPFADAFRRSLHPRSGDLLVLFKEGVILTDDPHGTDHASPYDDDSLVPLVLSGPGIRPGEHSGEVLAADLAPTLARLLGAGLAPLDGARVLDEALAAGR
jgi:predicted AlkP superfamily pyrophosphatase or phosphodiesterase